MKLDPITVEVVNNRLIEITNITVRAVSRTGYSSILREASDTNSGITDRKGRLVARCSSSPDHMGIYTPAVGAILSRYPYEEIKEGDVFIMNHPYLGGSPHVPDIMVSTPAFFEGELVGFVVNMTHLSDVGGLVPGSSSGNAAEIFHEGVLIPPVKYYSQGKINQEIEEIIKSNSRSPDMIGGDLRGQVGCTRVGVKRLQELFEEYGKEVILSCFDAVMDAVERRIKVEIRQWPDGTYSAEDYLDHDGIDLNKPIRIHVSVTKKGDKIIFDLTGCDPQTKGPMNMLSHRALTTCQNAVISMIDHTIAGNHGLHRVIEGRFKEGTVVNPRFPAPVNSHVMTERKVRACALKALGNFVPERVTGGWIGPGASSLGKRTIRSGKLGVLYEIFGTAHGGRPYGDGGSGCQIASSTQIIPIEMVESEFNVRIKRFELCRDSGGPGKFRGGLGFRREYEILEDMVHTLRSTGHKFPAQGVAGGKPGRPGVCIINPGRDDEKVLPAQTGGIELKAGDTLRLERPGGGGYGNPWERDPQRVLDDVIDAYVSIEGARNDYGVVIDPEKMKIDLAATKKLRAAVRK